MTSTFKRATRKKVRLRMAVDGPAGSGKSMTSLRLAFSLAQHIASQEKREPRVAVIDSENGSASLYQGLSPDEVRFDFDVVELTSFAPTTYTSLIEQAGRQNYDVLVIDSLSHAWAGKEGALEIKDRSPGNEFTAWRHVTPMHNAMIEAILTSPCHVFVTMRSKTEYVMVKNEKGQDVPKRIGMSPIQRAGMEYEFSVYCSMDWNHILTVTKSRCPAIEGLQIVKPGAPFILPLIEWLETGENSAVATPPTSIRDEQIGRLLELARLTNTSQDALRQRILRQYARQELHELTATQADDLIVRMEKSVPVPVMKRPLTNPQYQPPITMPSHQELEGSLETTEFPPASNGHPLASQSTPSLTGNSIPNIVEFVTDAQLARIKQLKDELAGYGLTADAYKAILAKRGVDSARKLTVSQADDLIAKLSHRLSTSQIERGMLGQPEPETSPVNLPVQEQTAPPNAEEKSTEAAPIASP